MIQKEKKLERKILTKEATKSKRWMSAEQPVPDWITSDQGGSPPHFHLAYIRVILVARHPILIVYHSSTHLGGCFELLRGPILP